MEDERAEACGRGPGLGIDAGVGLGVCCCVIANCPRSFVNLNKPVLSRRCLCAVWVVLVC